MHESAVSGAEIALSFEPEGSTDPSGLACLVSVARHYGLVLSVPQLIHDSLLSNQEVSPRQLVSCAVSAGMRAEAVALSWDELPKLDKALPVILRFKTGNYAVLLELRDKDGDGQQMILQDPRSGHDSLLTLDREGLLNIWMSEVILVRRRYDLRAEKQSFDFAFVKRLIFQERRAVRDIVICAFIMGAIVLSPILFWRVLIAGVYDKAYNTFNVVCAAFAMVVLFEAIIFYVRRFLIVQLADRVEGKLNKFVFDRILNLPMDFFERVPVGMVTQRVTYLRQLRSFLEGQLLGTLLDSVAFLFFIPVLFWTSPIAAAVVLIICAGIVGLLLKTLPGLRAKSKAFMVAEQDRGNFLIETLFGIRTVKSLALESRRRHQWDVHCAQVARAYVDRQRYSNYLGSVIKSLTELAVNGGLALAIFIAMVSSTGADPQTLFVFVILSRWAVSPFISIGQSVDAFDETRARSRTWVRSTTFPRNRGE